MWLRLGRVPALLAFLALYGVAIPVALLLDDPVDASVGVVLFAVFIVYCVARPDRGLDVFLYAASPGAGGTLLHDVFGISRLWGLLLLLVVLPALRDIDREPATAEPAT